MVAARLSLAGAVLLVASLFFTWLELPLFSGATGQAAGSTSQATEQSLDGWTVLESGDTILLFIGLVVIGLVALRRIEGPWLLVMSVGALAVVLSFVFSGVPMTEVYEQVYGESGFSYDAAKGVGMWIASAGTVVLLLAGVIQARDWLPARSAGPRRGGGSTEATAEPEADQPGLASPTRRRRARTTREAGGTRSLSDRGGDRPEGRRSRRSQG